MVYVNSCHTTPPKHSHVPARERPFGLHWTPEIDSIDPLSVQQPMCQNPNRWRHRCLAKLSIIKREQNHGSNFSFVRTTHNCTKTVHTDSEWIVKIEVEQPKLRDLNFCYSSWINHMERNTEFKDLIILHLQIYWEQRYFLSTKKRLSIRFLSMFREEADLNPGNNRVFFPSMFGSYRKKQTQGRARTEHCLPRCPIAGGFIGI